MVFSATGVVWSARGRARTTDVRALEITVLNIVDNIIWMGG